MRELVALDVTGPAFVDALRRAWDRGDAVAPLDPRLPPPARAAVLEALAPTAVLDAGGERTALAGGRPVEDGDALVVATSGTTGVPKAVVLTHAAVEASARATSDRLGVDPSTDTWLCCLPLSHVGGLSVVTRALRTGTPLVVHDRFDPAAVRAAAHDGATLTSLVPTALARIDPAAFRRILLGGQAPPAERPPWVIATYGLTETGSGIVYDGLPLDGVELRVADDGEVQVRAPMLLRAYRDGTDPRTADGWFPTGDLGELASGRLTVLGRRGDMIVTGGENVWPAPVERVLRRAPGVADVAVVGRPDPEWGQRVVAVVVPSDPARPPTLQDLREVVRAELPAYAAPRAVELVARLPRTASGKVRREDLGTVT
ncbi:MAG: class I adenylate-forming enzyme family protein [Acidimicrobiia bacterium]